jgi:hypothetical protein
VINRSWSWLLIQFQTDSKILHAKVTKEKARVQSRYAVADRLHKRVLWKTETNNVPGEPCAKYGALLSIIFHPLDYPGQL